jgi:hypothetical protein
MAGALFAVAAQADGPLAMNNPVMVSGIETVCTGIAETRDDPRWPAYPVRIELSNTAAQLVADAHVVLVKAGGAKLAEFDCPASIVLFKLAPGRYKVTATISPSPRGTVSADFNAPSKGQKRVELVFTGTSAK